MKIKNIVTVLFVVFILVSCAPVANVVPLKTAISTLTFTSVPLKTAISTLTFTPVPPTITSIPINYIKGLTTVSNLQAPDDIFIEQSAEQSYLGVMEISLEQVKLIYVECKDFNRNAFVVMVDNSTNIPLAIATQNFDTSNWDWEKASLSELARKKGLEIVASSLSERNRTWSIFSL